MTANENQIYYHWAPTSRRGQINRYGLLPGRWSSDRLWKPPYVCLAPYPQLAWLLSGGTYRGSQIASWDLWEAFLGEQKGYEGLYFDGQGKNPNLKEVRVYERVYKRNVWYVGSRAL